MKTENPDLIDELKDAMMSRNRAQADLDEEMVRLAEAKAAIRERRELLAAREKTLREIEHELLTGEPSLPLLAAPAAAGRNGDGGPSEPARGDPGELERRARAELFGGPGPVVSIGLPGADDPLDPPWPAPRVAGDPSARAEVIQPGAIAAVADGFRAEMEWPSASVREYPDWATVPVEDLMAPIGPAGAAIAARLRGEQDCATAGDVADTIEIWGFDAFDLSEAETGAIRDALATFRVNRGWTAETMWPDGIPAAWLDDDQGGAEEPAAAGAGEPDTFTELHAGPADEHEALRRAMGYVPAIWGLVKTGASDAEILDALKAWPTQRFRPGLAGGQPWGVRGGDAPMFFYGQSTEYNWPQGPPFITGHGEKLAHAVRRLLKIPHPRPAGSPEKPKNRDSGKPARAARKADGEALPPRITAEGKIIARELAGAGYRECTRAEYRAAAAADRHPRYRAVRTGPAPADPAPEAAPLGSRENPVAQPGAEAPVRDPAEWRSEDLDAALRAALGWGGASERLTHASKPPTSLEILGELGDCWSNSAHIHKHAKGYRVRGGRTPAFWMGTSTDRKPTLEGAALVERVRRVLHIGEPKPADPRPSGAARRKASRAKLPPAEATPAPIAGGAPVRDRICNRCDTRRPAAVGRCRCGSPEFRLAPEGVAGG